MNTINLSTKPSDTSSARFQVRVDLLVGTNCEIKFDALEYDLDDNLTLSVAEKPVSPGDDGNNINCFRLCLGPFPTTDYADSAGHRFVRSLLWCGISFRIALQLLGTGEKLFCIEEYKTSRGIEIHGFGHVYYDLSPRDFTSTLQKAYSNLPGTPSDIQIAMESLCGARFERSLTTRFIQTITALEALSVQEHYDDKVAQLLKSTAEAVRNDKLFEDAQYQSIRDSLCGRIKGLRRQSVSQAIQRVLRDNAIEEDTVKFVKGLYDKRSKILHEGKAHDLSEQDLQEVENVIRKLISKKLGLTLDRIE